MRPRTEGPASGGLPSRFLYRYFRNIDHLADALAHRRLYHSLPCELNDPFDCAPLISLRRASPGDDGVWRRLFYCLAREQWPTLPSSEHEKHADAAVSNGLHRQLNWLDDMDAGFKEIRLLVRVCCFSRSARNGVMWAHYANGYKGVALQFRASHLRDAPSGEFRGQEVDYVGRVLGVREYTAALEAAMLRSDVIPLAKLFHATKTMEWAGEQEVRFFARHDQPYVAFNEAALVGIIVGHNAESAVVDMVSSKVRSWATPPRLFRTSIKDSVHKLWIGRL